MFENLKQAYLPETEFPQRVIDADKCIQCGRCHETCPSCGFEWEKGKVPKPIGYGGLKEACLNCGNCIAVCPTDAIRISGSYNVHSGRYKTRLLKKVSFPDPLQLNGEKTYEEFQDELTETEQIIYSRRSNRLFKEKEVPRNIIQRVLEAGRFAPSAGNGQPYKFIIITDKAVIHEMEYKAMKALRLLKNLYLEKNGKRPLWKKVIFTLASWINVNKLDPRPMTAMEKADKRNGRMYFNAPAMILILKDTRGISNPDLDAGICCQNMVLAAHALKLGTCIISLPIEPLNMPIMAGFRKKIGIKAPFKAITSIALGYPKGKIDGVVKRDSPEVTWIT
ncbi:MAG: nitroreductase family protein [Pseudomonadota bacterium]